MKTILFLAIVLAIFQPAEAQVLKRLADRTKDKLERKAGDKIEKGIDDTVDGNKKSSKKKEKSSNEGPDATPQDNGSSPTGNNPADKPAAEEETDNKVAPAAPPSLKAYSKYDFIPGEKILVFEDFAQDAIGDFPGKWNTDASGEIVRLDGQEGKWFKINKEGAYLPEFITSLPENFTLEFDLGVIDNFSYYSTPLWLSMVHLDKPADEFNSWGAYNRSNGKHSVRFNIHPEEAGGGKGRSRVVTATGTGKQLIENTVSASEFNNKNKLVTHVAIWRQKQRMRVYVNQEKIWDLPKAFAEEASYNSIVLGTAGFHKDRDFYVLTNIRLAVGAPDTRSKLITEGKFVSHGILFDVNSASIKPESYGAIKDIANVLSENGSVKVKVIGHTDSDGDENANLELSKKRAAAVKSVLAGEFGIDGSRIETDGMGESQPVDKGDTPLAKAQNRRVEFIKL